MSIKQNKLAIYQAKNGAIELNVDAKHETIWATQAQMAEVFNVDQSGIARHIKNILKDEEVAKKSNMQKMHIANSDKPVTLYSLDIVLAVGYRANSSRAIAFRQWATKTLKTYITDGFDVNIPAINKHIPNIIDEGELGEATISKQEIVQNEDNHDIYVTQQPKIIVLA